MKIPRTGYLWFAAPRAFTMAGASAKRPPAVPTTWIGAGLGFNRFVTEAASALCFQNTLLHAAQLDLQYFHELMLLQRMKHDDLVEPVNEFRGKLAPGRFHGSA